MSLQPSRASSASLEVMQQIQSIPTVQSGGSWFYCFQDRVIAVVRVLQIIPLGNGQYQVYTEDFKQINGLTLYI